MSNSSVARRYLSDAGMANGYEQPINWARIVVLVAVALPVFGGLYYALLDFFCSDERTSKMEETTALTVVVAIIALVAIYSLWALRGRK